MEALPQMLAQAMAGVLAQVPVAVRQMPCAQCLAERKTWAVAHAAEISEAEGRFRAAAGEMGQRAPEDQVQLSFAEFLPPGMPPIQEPATMAGGTLLCSQHLPVAAPAQPQSPLVIAQAHITPSMMAELARR